MDNTRKNEIRNLNIKAVVSLIFIGTTILSIILLLNEKYYLKDGKYIINKRKAQDISLFARTLDLILILILLYINYDDRKVARDNNNLKNNTLQISASVFSAISAAIVVYVILNSSDSNSLADLENPIV